MESSKASGLGQVCLQVQLDRAPTVDVAALERYAEAVAQRTKGVRGFESTRSDSDGPHVNLTFAVEQPVEAWRALRAQLLDSPEFGETLRTSSICVCTGEDGWNDYLLLSHYDASLETDDDRSPPASA